MKEAQVEQHRIRRSREENREITRAKIIRMGRKHFLANGYAGTILEQVAEEAGFSRGALYSNFSGKEELFLAVFDNDLHMKVAAYHQILDADMPAGTRIPKLRAAFVEHVTDRDWGALRTEFEFGATHNEILRKRFIQIHHRDLENAIALAQKAVHKGELLLSIPVDDFILATQSFMMGLAIKQRLLSRELPSHKLRSIAEAFFDCFIASPLKKGAKSKEKVSR